MALRPPQTGTETPQRDILTISRLNAEVKATLESGFPLLWVEGEISNLARPASGHLYFSLKDSQAQVRCAMFRQRNMHLRFRPENGMQVLVRAKVSFYAPRGDFQLIVEHMEEAGDGALQRAFDELKHRLANEGLFDTERKRPLPTLPKRIGVVTSPSGAAIRDILSILRRRFPAIPVIIYPTAVQGSGAGAEIAAAIRTAGERAECDVLIVGRGGGSLEDLWAFNEEGVARAIHASPIPVVSAVGHEVDVTIADFAADRRAPTPSAAAELLSPDREEWQQRLDRIEQRLHASFARQMVRRGQQLDALQRRLQHPGRRLQEIRRRLESLQQRLDRAQRTRLQHRASHLAALQARLQQHTPLHRLQRLGDQQIHLARRLRGAMTHLLEQRRQQLAATARALDTVSPLATLGRGYAIVQRPDGRVVRSAGEVQRGEAISARLGHGRLLCRVEETQND